MKLATIRLDGVTAAVRMEADGAVPVDGARDVGDLLADPAWRERARAADGPPLPLAGLDFAPLVPRPEKIVCVGLNYRGHIAEMGHPLPERPTLFAKFATALIGAFDPITLPSASDEVDWEAELAVIIGAEVRHADITAARAAIAGYSVINDVSVRDFQFRTGQWLAGKTFDGTTPFGPYLVTDDEAVKDGVLAHELSCEIDGELVQRASTAELVFDPARLVSYISSIMTLRPGDVIASGTPGGVGHARDPRRYLMDGQVVTTRVVGIGETRNLCQREPR